MRDSLTRILTLVAVVVVVAVAAWSAWAPTLLGAAEQGPVGRDCVGLQGPVDRRVDACLAELQPTRPSPGMREALVAEAGRGRMLGLANLSLEGVTTTPVGDVAGLRELLLASDEPAAAARLREAGITSLVIDRDLALAVDRDASVLARLVHHDFLEWHELGRVGHGLLLYRVREASNRTPDAVGQRLAEGLRARLAGAEPPPQEWTPDSVLMMGGLRLQGNLLAVRFAAHEDIERALDGLATKLDSEWRRKVEVEGHGRLQDRLDETRIEVWILVERAPVEPRSQAAIAELWELGVDGMIFQQRPGVEDAKFSVYPGSEAITRSMLDADAFLRFAVSENGWHDLRPWEQDPRTRLDLIRTQHFVEAEPGGGRVVRLVRAMPEILQEQIDDRAVQRMLVEGAEWWMHNRRPDGSFEYKYWPTQNRRSEEYNEVRHILAARDLADAYRYRRDPRYLEGARAAMDWLMQFAVRDTDPRDPDFPHPPAGAMLFRYPSRELAKQMGKAPNQKLGTVAVGLLGWVSWARATGSHEEDARIRAMASYVLSQLEDDGRFRAYNVPRSHKYAKQRNDIVPGEAALALGEVAEYFDEPEWVAFYPKFVAHYRPWFRERAERRRPAGRWPHGTYDNTDRLDLVQFGPWSVMAANQIHQITGDPEAAEFGLEVAEWMIESYAWSAERSPWPDYVGGYYKLPHELPAMQSFCYSEGTAAAWGLANRAAPERAERFERATRESIRFLAAMQFDEHDSWYVARPEKVRGGIRYAMNENKIRIDYVGHGLSTLAQYLDVRAEESEPLDIVDPAGFATSPLRPGRARGPGAPGQ